MRQVFGAAPLLLAALALWAASARGAGASARLAPRRAPLRARPVVLVPGDGGCQLEARWSVPSTRHAFCPRDSHGWRTIWLQVHDLLPGEVDCWSDLIRVQYLGAPHRYANASGVEMRVPGFGDKRSVEALDPDLALGTQYMHALVRALVQRGGLERGAGGVAAAPYDFRLTPWSNAALQGDFAALVERSFARAGGRRVALLSHSMGSLVTLALLRAQGAEWARKFVHSWTSLAGVFGGAAMEARLHASGDNVGIAFVRSASVVAEQRTYESNQWMLPNPRAFGDQVLLEVPHLNLSYAASDHARLLRDVGFAQGAEVHRALDARLGDLPAPGVRVRLVIGTGVPTPERFVYTKGDRESWFHSDPEHVLTGPGDGTVNERSLEFPLKWRAEQTQEVSLHLHPGVSHAALVSDSKVIDEFLSWISRDEPELELEQVPA